MADSLTFTHLDETQRGTFRSLLGAVYSKRHGLKKLLDEKLGGKNLDDISDSGSRQEDYDELVTVANAEGWIARLIRAVMDDRE